MIAPLARLLLLLGLLGCAPAPLVASIESEAGTATITASRPGFAVELTDTDGLPVVRGTAPANTLVATLALPPGAHGTLTAHVRAGGDSVERSLDLDSTALRAELPLGVPRLVHPGDTVAVALLEGATAYGRVAGGDFFALRPPRLIVEVPGGRVTVEVSAVSLADARGSLGVQEVVFPATESGAVDLVRPEGRVALPSKWWRDILDRSSLGVRARDEFTAWAWTSVRLHNSGAAAIDVVVRSRILGPDGAPDPAFRPRVRAADDGTGNTSVLLRVPPGGAAATIPLFVDESLLGAGPWTRVIEVLPLGLTEPLLREEAPLYVSRSSSWVAAGLALTLTTALAGLTMAAFGVRRWLRKFDTAALVTIALFSALTFVAGTVGQLIGLGAAAAAGPFATMVTGIVDDALQATLLGALITVLPRRGVASLTVLVSWLLRGVATGTLSPMDVVFVACRIATLEGGLWLFGLTRGAAWREEPRWRRVLRLGFGLAVGSFAGTAASLVLHSALFRLYFAPWYVVMVLLGPGFLYVLAAAGVADRVATQLRRVED